MQVLGGQGVISRTGYHKLLKPWISILRGWTRCFKVTLQTSVSMGGWAEGQAWAHTGARTIKFTVFVPKRNNFFNFSTLGPTGGPSDATNTTNDGAKGKEGPTSVSFLDISFGNDEAVCHSSYLSGSPGHSPCWRCTETSRVRQARNAETSTLVWTMTFQHKLSGWK